MDYFDVDHIPEGFLRACFKTSSQAQTQHLAELFAPVVRALIEKAQGNQKICIGLEGEPKSGKTPVAKKLISKLSAHTIDEDERGFSTLFAMGDNKIGWHHDNEGFTGFQHETLEETQALREMADNASLEIVEWPLRETFNILFSFYYEQGIDREQDTPREIELYLTDEIAAMPEFQQFLEDAAPFMIK